jgi:hypothetical protein
MRRRNWRRVLCAALLVGVLGVFPVAAHADGGMLGSGTAVGTTDDGGVIGSGTRAGGYLGSGN